MKKTTVNRTAVPVPPSRANPIGPGIAGDISTDFSPCRRCGAVPSDPPACAHPGGCGRCWKQDLLGCGVGGSWGAGPAPRVTAGQPGARLPGAATSSACGDESWRMPHCAGPHALIPAGQSCIVGIKKRENTKSIQTLFFSFEEPFCFVELCWAARAACRATDRI